MITPDDARRTIREAEEDITQRKYHYQWAQAYAQAADPLEAGGLSEEAIQARWMAHLMSLPFTPVTAEAKVSGSWFATQTDEVDANLAQITEEMLDYFAARSQNMANPIIKVRCCEIIWSKRKKAHNFARSAVDAHIESARIFCGRGVWSQSQVHLSRAIGLAKLLNAQDKLQKCKDEWNRQLELLSDLSAPAPVLLANLIDLGYLLGNELSVDERREIAVKCESVAASFGQSDLLSEQDWLSKARRLFRDTRDPEAERRCVAAIAQSAQRWAEVYIKNGGFIDAIRSLEKARGHYSELGPEYAEQADRVRIMLSEANRKAVEHMPHIGVSVKIPAEIVEDCTSALRQMPLHEALASVFGDRSFVPRVEEIREEAEKTAVLLLSHIPAVMHDGRNTVARADPGNSEEYHLFQLFQEMDLRWQPRSAWLTFLVRTILETHAVTPDDFSFLLPRSLMEPSGRALVTRGLERYLQDDFISALHILVPQFEACIRNLLRALGRPTSRPKKGPLKGLSQEKLLNEMLGEKEKKLRPLLGDDLWYFYRFFFSDERGWKIRHEICHGLADETKFNDANATTVVYALVSLGWLDLEAG